jgi:hypothetical protein
MPRVVVVDCCSHSCYVANSEGLSHLRMQLKGLEGVLHVRELGLFSHPLCCGAGDSGQPDGTEGRVRNAGRMSEEAPGRDFQSGIYSWIQLCF